MTEPTPAMPSAVDLVRRLGTRYPEALSADARGALVVRAADLQAVARNLRDEDGFDYLANMTVVDWRDRFEAVYHICRTVGGPPLTVRVVADRDRPEVPTLVPVYPGADFQEREAYDMYGVRFVGHPNLRRILLWEGFAGFPLRKDWKEPYFEAENKPFPSRWPDGRFFFAEDVLSEWPGNEQYPAGYTATDLRADSLPPAPVLEVDSLVDGDGDGVGAEERLARDPDLGSEFLVVNMGPQHPSTHGVFQMRLTLDGETVVELEPIMGYMHRNHEQIGERNLWLANMPFTDRLDYIAQLGNEWGYAITVEKLLGVEVPERAEHIRIILGELNRIQSHLWSIGFLLNDLGAFFTPSLYAIEERELILDLFEMVTGSRLMCNYFRFGGVAADLPEEFMPLARALVDGRIERAVDEMDAYLTGSEIVSSRMKGVGVIPPELAIAYSSTGPVLRGCGVPYDVRTAEPYGIYDRFDWDVVTWPSCDVFARYMVRLGEVRESLKIVRQAMDALPPGEIQGGKKAWQIRVPEGDSYGRVENPRGELGYYCVSDGKANPYRYHVRSPCFVNLTALAEMCRGHKVADVVAILGSLDIVLGEVDR